MQTAIQTEALIRATTGASVANYSAIFAGFEAKGIPASEIEPRVNVLTYNAWKAKGRQVRKGEHGVRVFTFISGERQTESGERKSFRSPRAATVFHVSQTDAVQ
jgi:hypothetical protein